MSYTDRKVGMFRLDPSPWKKSEKNEIFVALKLPRPPDGKLVETVVRETEKFKEIVNNEVKETKINYISAWDLVDPKKLRRTRNFSKDDYMDFLIEPLTENYYLGSIREILGMATVASPRINDVQKGGINTVVLGKFSDGDNWKKYKQITKVVPKEFRKESSSNFYKNLETKEVPDPIGCNEVSLSYYNVTESPFDIPLPFNVEFKSKASYAENQGIIFPFARGFLLDTLLFQPEIADEDVKTFENIMYDSTQEFSKLYNVMPNIRRGISVVRLATSYARLNFEVVASRNTMKKSTDAWAVLADEILTTGATVQSHSGVLNLPPDEMAVMNELTLMEETGIALTVLNLIQRHLKLVKPLSNVLKKLVDKNYIYFPNKDTIRFIKD